MRTKISGAKYSAIVAIGEELKKLTEETGKEYLALNRGVNAVTLIDLNPIVDKIDFNTTEMQVYPANTGISSLRNAINQEYFGGTINPDHLYITNGGMGALDLIIRTLDTDTIYAQSYYWGAYRNIMNINEVAIETYANFKWLEENLELIKGKAVIICDPNNPLGTNYPDEQLLDLVNLLAQNNVTVIWDGPYRRLFLDRTDTMYQELAQMNNVIFSESFSKSIGLSGQRLGFIYVKDQEFREELTIRVLYATNGINAFSQILVARLLDTEVGQKVVSEFKKATVAGIKQNIAYLKEKGLLAEQFYTDADPVGIFVVVNKTYEELLDKRIGSVPLEFFTSLKEEAKGNCRICVSVPHDKFVAFFSTL